MQRRNIFIVILLLLGVGTGIYFYTKPPTPDSDGAPLKVTINSWIGWAPLYLAQAKNLNGGANLEITRVEDTGARKTTMISGRVDGYASSVDNFALDSAQGVPGKIVLAFDESYGADGIVAKKTISSVGDLKGKTVGFQKGLPSHFLLLSALKRGGLNPGDVVQQDLDADKAGAAFVAGSLDAAVTWEPWISKAAAMSDGKILLTTKEFEGLIVDTLVFREKVLEQRKEEVSKVINGWFAALEYWNAHKDEADKIMADAYGLKVEEFRDMVSGVRFYDKAKNQSYFGTAGDAPIHKVFDSASQLWIVAGMIQKAEPSAARIDGSFLR